MEDLAKRLETAYISDGLPVEVASTYATKTAVKAIVKNATNDKIRLVMDSGNFSTMNEVMANFVNSCTEVFGQFNSVLFYGSDNRGNGSNRRQFLGNRYMNNNRRNNNNKIDNRYSHST